MTFEEYWAGINLPADGNYAPLYDAAKRAFQEGYLQGQAFEAERLGAVLPDAAIGRNRYEFVKEMVHELGLDKGPSPHLAETMARAERAHFREVVVPEAAAEIERDLTALIDTPGLEVEFDSNEVNK